VLNLLNDIRLQIIARPGSFLNSCLKKGFKELFFGTADILDGIKLAEIRCVFAGLFLLGRCTIKREVVAA
jgi:hypothetical protein